MNNKAVFLYLVIFGFACNTKGHRGSSENIQTATEHGTLIGQLSAYPSNDKVAKIIDNRIEEAFIEYSWFVTSSDRKIDSDAINFVLRMSEENIDFFTNDFQIMAGKIGLFTRHSKQNLWLIVNDTEQDISDVQISEAHTITFNLLKDEQSKGEIYFIRK
jgi:hypothetical protein